MINRVAVLVALAAGSLGAQEQARDTARVSPVVVTATRTPMARSSLPVAVTVIQGEDLRVRGISTVAEALNDVTSAYVAQSGSRGATTSLFLRGGESKYVKVLIDGVAVNDPGGVYDFGSLTTDNIERIEVVRGPASVIHGADAVTGAVHVITRKGTAMPRVDLDLSVGAMPRDPRVNTLDDARMSTFDGTASAHGGLTSGSYSFAVGRHHSGGLYDLNNEYMSNVASALVEMTPVTGTTVRFTARYTDYRFNYPTGGGGTESPGDVNAFRTEDRTVLALAAERSVGQSHRLVLTLNSSENNGGTDDQMDAAGGDVFVSIDRVRRRGAELRDHISFSDRASLTVGAQFEQQDQRSQYQSDGPFGPFNDRFAASRYSVGGYTELVAQPLSALAATLGARLDHNEQFGDFTTGRAGISWQLAAGTRFRATAGTAFREPSFFENYATGFISGNPDLEPERSLVFDGGVDQDLLGGRARVELTGFVQRFQNMIDYTGSAAACGYSYCNVAVARANGVEAELRLAPISPVTFSGGITLLRTEVITPGFDTGPSGLYRQGESLIRRPETKWNAEVWYRPSQRLSVTARILGVGKRADRDFNNFTPVELDACQRMDLGAEYVIDVPRVDRAALTTRVENVGNVYYENVFNYLAPRRTISIGTRVSF